LNLVWSICILEEGLASYLIEKVSAVEGVNSFVEIVLQHAQAFDDIFLDTMRNGS
jgi:hypothetical protein